MNIIPLLSKPYENEVTLTGQNLPLKCLEPWPNAIVHTLAGMTEAAEFFMRTPTLTASEIEALLSKESKFAVLEDLNFLRENTKNKQASNIVRVGFALSK